MSIKLWDWLEDLNWLVGADFPEADEDALWRCSDAWATAAADLRNLSSEAVVAGERVMGVLGGESGDAFADLWRRYAAQDGLVEHVAAACEQLALACDNAAIEVEYAKIQYIAALVVLAVALAALTASLVAGGVSALGMPVAIAAAQFAVRLVLMRLITAMAMGTAFNVALDGVAQGIQLLAGHRHEWDLAKTGRAAEDGAIYGAVGGGVFLAANRFLPGLLRNPLRLAVPLAATGAIGGTAAPLAHGELPTGHDFLLALTSGIAGGLGPDLVHGRTLTPDLSRLDTLDGGGRVELGSIADTLTDAVAPAGLDHVRNGFASPQTGDAKTLSPATTAESVADSNETPAKRSGSHDTTRPDDRGQLAGGALPESARPDHGTGARPDQGADSTGVGSVPAGSLTPAAHRPQMVGRIDAPTAFGGVTSAIVGGASVPPHAVASGSAPPLATTAAAPAHSGPTGPVPGASAASASPPGTHGAAASAPAASSAPSTSAPTTSAPTTSASSVGGTPATAGLVATQTVGLQGVETSPATVIGIQPIPAGGRTNAGSSTAASSMDNAAWQVRDAAASNLSGWSGSEDGTKLTGLQNHAADLLLARAKEVEPRITEITRDIARDVGGALFGEENRLKAAESLKAKLSLKPAGEPLAKSLAGMNDTLRYTIGLPEDRYARGAQDAVGQLLDRGFRPVGEFRRWSATSGYLGYNTTWSDPASGHVFEVQFHTESSFVAKTISHPAYEALRAVPRAQRDTPEYRALQAAHDAYFVDVPIPDGARDVRIPKNVPRYDPSGDLPDLPDLLHQRSADDGPGLPIMGDDTRRLATDAEALDLVRHNVFDTNAGLGFYTPDDDVRDFARAVHPTDGYVTLDLHGSARGFQIGNRLLTVTQFADALQELRAAGVLDLPAGVGIKLLSCDTARGDVNSPAAVLARRLGVEVIAPDEPVWTALNGAEVVSSPTLLYGNLVPTYPPDGTWIRFAPNAAAAASQESERQ